MKISDLLPAALLPVLVLTFFAAAPARAQMIDHPVAKLQSLDKITARTMTFEVKVGTTVKYGPLYIKAQSCRKSSPIDSPEAAAFLQIWEVTPADEAKWVFSGWMFASSPSLSAMDHAVYDVWVLDCRDPEAERLAAEAVAKAAEEAVKAGEAGEKTEKENPSVDEIVEEIPPPQ